MSSYWRFHKFLSTMDDPLGYEIETSEQVTRAVDVPTIVTGRIMTLDHASHLVESGVADMVSIVRAMIADPHLVVKARAGREAEIRPCIGTSMGCVAQLMTTGKLQCVVNVAAGNETTVPFETPAPAPVAKKVLVIGGGPAGLEAARTAALRGHDVELYEMAGFLGGQVQVAARAPHRSDLEAITRFLADEIDRLGVKVHLRTPVDPDLVIDAHPDEVILATGSTPRRDGFQLSSPSRPVPGATLPHVYTVWDVLGFGGRADRRHDRGRLRRHRRRSRPSRPPTCSSPPGPPSRSSSRFEQLGANITYPPATVEASRERLLGAGARFVPAMVLREITPTEVVAHGRRQRPRRLVPGRHGRHRHLPRAQRRARPAPTGSRAERARGRQRRRYRHDPGRHPLGRCHHPPALTRRSRDRACPGGRTMIKVVAFIKRRSDLDLAAFRAYYEQHHVPLIDRLLPFYDGYRRNYLVAPFRDGEPSMGYDVITELRFASQEDYEGWRAALSDPAVLQQIHDDERNFLEPGTTRMWVVDEHGHDHTVGGRPAS